jgi:hypothetical protein
VLYLNTRDKPLGISELQDSLERMLSIDVQFQDAGVVSVRLLSSLRFADKLS